MTSLACHIPLTTLSPSPNHNCSPQEWRKGVRTRGKRRCSSLCRTTTLSLSKLHAKDWPRLRRCARASRPRDPFREPCLLSLLRPPFPLRCDRRPRFAEGGSLPRVRQWPCRRRMIFCSSQTRAPPATANTPSESPLQGLVVESRDPRCPRVPTVDAQAGKRASEEAAMEHLVELMLR